MKRWILATALSAGSVPLFAGPFDQGDFTTGKALVDQQCTACHIERFGGDGSKVYTRPDRKIKSAQRLTEQVAACNKMAKAGLTAQEQADVGAYLNRTFYKFPR